MMFGILSLPRDCLSLLIQLQKGGTVRRVDTQLPRANPKARTLPPAWPHHTFGRRPCLSNLIGPALENC